MKLRFALIAWAMVATPVTHAHTGHEGLREDAVIDCVSLLESSRLDLIKTVEREDLSARVRELSARAHRGLITAIDVHRGLNNLRLSELERGLQTFTTADLLQPGDITVAVPPVHPEGDHLGFPSAKHLAAVQGRISKLLQLDDGRGHATLKSFVVEGAEDIEAYLRLVQVWRKVVAEASGSALARKSELENFERQLLVRVTTRLDSRPRFAFHGSTVWLPPNLVIEMMLATGAPSRRPRQEVDRRVIRQASQVLNTQRAAGNSVEGLVPVTIDRVYSEADSGQSSYLVVMRLDASADHP